jgi:benzoate-CoA ligase family protein
MDIYNGAVWLVERHVQEGRGDRTAIRYQGRSITYVELQADIERAQQALADIGLRAGDRIAIVANDEPALISWFLGALRGGFVPIPLSTMLTSAELAPIVADSGATAIAVSTQHEGHIATVAEACPDLRTAVVFGQPTIEAPSSLDVVDAAQFRSASHAAAETTTETPAFWLYSSGTTGLPKGVIHTHGNIQATAETYAAYVLRTNENDRFYSIAKLFFAYGLGNSMSFPFAVGATAILDPRPPTPSDVLEVIAVERPTLFFASPGFVAALLDTDADASAMSSVRATVTAGESLPGDLLRRFTERFGHPVLDGIGSTEALHIFISNTLDEQRPGSTGQAVPGYDLELRDEAGYQFVAEETPGYLHVRGPSCAKGYWDRETETAAAFLDGWLKTGDVYTRSADGYWHFLGRNNDMIKAGGIWVSPAEVESVLIEHPDVLEAAVVGERDAAGLEMAVAFVVPASGRAIDSDVLERHCRDRMASFKRPRRIIEVQDLPKTATGKIKRFALRMDLDGRN